MTLTEFINKELNPNIKESIFLMGNGINNHCQTTSSWKDLLTALAETYIGTGQHDYDKILKDNSVSYPEFFDLIQVSCDASDETFDYRTIKNGIKEGFEKWKSQNAHKLWTDKMIELGRPLLTTNYDYLLEYSNDDIKDFMRSRQYNKQFFRPLHINKTKKGRPKGFTPFYPWHSYYSNQQISNASKEFAIWHIHGFCEYTSSIRLGLSDYMGAVGKARRWLLKSTGNPSNKRSELKKWVGNNSWLDIFINNNVAIVGLSLEVQESFLRWLLIEREKLYKKHPDIRKKTWFIHNKNDRMKAGKKLFFEKLNIEVIEATSYKQIYEGIPKKLKLTE
jgi:hypothetical protein